MVLRLRDTEEEANLYIKTSGGKIITVNIPSNSETISSIKK